MEANSSIGGQRAALPGSAEAPRLYAGERTHLRRRGPWPDRSEATRSGGVAREAQPYRTELTPVAFMRRSYVSREDRRRARRAALHVSSAEERANRLARASAPSASGISTAWRHRPKHAAMLEAPYGVPARPGPGADQKRASATANSVHPDPLGARFVFVDHEIEGLVKPLDLGTWDHSRRRHRSAGDPYEDFSPAASPSRRDLARDEYETLSINYTSGNGPTQGRDGAHRGAYLNAHCEILETRHAVRAKYLWTAADVPLKGWFFTWSVTALGGTHVCLRRGGASRIWTSSTRRDTHTAARRLCRSGRQ